MFFLFSIDYIINTIIQADEYKECNEMTYAKIVAISKNNNSSILEFENKINN